MVPAAPPSGCSKDRTIVGSAKRRRWSLPARVRTGSGPLAGGDHCGAAGPQADGRGSTERRQEVLDRTAAGGGAAPSLLSCSTPALRASRDCCSSASGWPRADLAEDFAEEEEEEEEEEHRQQRRRNVNQSESGSTLIQVKREPAIAADIAIGDSGFQYAPSLPRGLDCEPSGDAHLVAALREGREGAERLLFQRHSHYVESVLANVIGLDAELPDMLHEVFVRALSCIERLRSPKRLRAWLAGIAVHVARACIRSRKRIRFFAPNELVERPTTEAPPEVRAALRSTYEVLDELPTELRLVFALRFINGMCVREIATACSTSPATVKRRLRRAQRRFVVRARRHPELDTWLPKPGGQK